MRYFIIVFSQNPDNNYYQRFIERGHKGSKFPNREELLSLVASKDKNFSIVNIIELKSEEDYNNYFK